MVAIYLKKIEVVLFRGEQKEFSLGWSENSIFVPFLSRKYQFRVLGKKYFFLAICYYLFAAYISPGTIYISTILLTSLNNVQ